MKLLYKSMSNFVIGEYTGYEAEGVPVFSYFSVETDGNTLCVTLSPMAVERESYPDGVSVPVTYNGVTKYLSGVPFDSPLTAQFAYSDSVRSVHIGTAVYFDGENHTDGADISWKSSAAGPSPSLELSIEGIRNENGNLRLSWSIGAPEGYHACLVQIEYRVYRAESGGTFESRRHVSPTKITGDSTQYYFSIKEGDRLTIRAYAALYSGSEDAVGDYIGLTMAETRELIAAGEKQHFPPYDMKVSCPVSGAPVKISWKRPNDNFASSSCELERAVNGGGYSLIYSGSSESFSETVGDDWDSVSYRVRAVADYSFYTSSIWTDTGSLDVIKTNVYVGGKPAAAMFVGTPSGIRSLIPIMRIGRG
ncbi:MAG: hypothetical protein ACI4XJ_00940 [Eubacteriales bacterium]